MATAVGQEEGDGAAANQIKGDVDDPNDGYGPGGWRGEGTMDPQPAY